MKEPTVDYRLMLERYERAQTLIQAAYGAKTLAYNTTVSPHWIGDSDCFWYEQHSAGGTSMHVVDALKKTNTGVKGVDAFKEGDSQSEQVTISPDGKKAAFVRDYNLWLRDLISGDERPLTIDGETFYAYGGAVTVTGGVYAPQRDFLWSPDSKQLLSHVIDTRKVGRPMPLVQHVPLDGSLRPTIARPDRRAAMVGDKEVEMWQLLSIEVESGRPQKIDYIPCPMSYPFYLGYYMAGRGWWDRDSRHAYGVYQDSVGDNTRVIKWDTHTGQAQVLFDEMPGSFATLITASNTRVAFKPVPETDELIWYSERSGWAHLYLYDLKSGTLKNAITSGEWLVRNICHVDGERRELIIQTAGRVTDRNAYYRDICRVHMDTGELTELIGSNHEYYMVESDEAAGISAVSPNGRFIVATRSRVDEVPVTLLIDRDGKTEPWTVETADISALPNDWQWPEPVQVKGADNQTDIYGVIYRPSGFSADQFYPVVDLSFSFQEPAGSFTNNAQSHWRYFMGQAFAELGFIVVAFNHRSDGLTGGAGLRDHAFNSYRDTSLPFCNMADCVAGIRQLCERHPYMDINRVGVASMSVPTALTGLLIYPDLYKVGVSVNAQADFRFYPINYGGGVGLCDFPPYENFAHQLKGKLLMIHGMLDDVLPVSGTFRVAEALQKANKHFDMLLLPNVDHFGSDYCTRRTWDYLVEHLLGDKPPEDFDLKVTGIVSND